MNFVYLCRSGENEELKYSIRSLYKNIESVNIWVVGGKPDWYCGNYVKVDQNHTKHVNVRNNLKKIVNDKSIPNDFVLMNDDFFIMKPINNIPVLHGGRLEDKVNLFKKNNPKSSYTVMLSDTYKKLISLGIKEPLDYAIHVPMTINKNLLSSCIYPSLSIRTMYGNLNSIGGKQISDVKIYEKEKHIGNPNYLNGDNVFLSTNDKSFNILLNHILLDIFNQKSILEK